jgi:uncharacterized RDD family membrane protein YckC
MEQKAYAGFWIRTAASLIDSILVLVVIVPLLTAIYGSEYWLGDPAITGPWDMFLNYVFPAVAVIVFWIYKSATPGKMMLRLCIVDAKTGGKPSTKQFLGRYLGYYVAAIPLFLGIVWVAVDKYKQGWHDKLAGTVVIRNNGD